MQSIRVDKSTGKILNPLIFFHFKDNEFCLESLTNTYMIIRHRGGRQVHVLLNPETLTIAELIANTNIPFSFQDYYSKLPVSFSLNRVLSYAELRETIDATFEIIEEGENTNEFDV